MDPIQNLYNLLGGFATLFGEPTALFMVFFGALFGVLIGAIPGLTTSAAIAMVLPITFLMSPLTGLTFLYVVGKAGRFGGSIAAILFNTPGTAAAAATQIDGYPLAQQGKAGKAMKMATLASASADFMGDVVLILFAALIATYTVRLGPPEYFAIYVMAFIVIGSVVGKSIPKGLISSLFGILIAMVGLEIISGTTRYDFGNVNLMNGLQLVPILIGVFVISEVMVQAERTFGSTESLYIAPPSVNKADQEISREELRMCVPVIARSALTGGFIGLMPGLGSAVACFIAYGEERRRAKRPHLWGKGAIEGVAAPEAANNAVTGPSMIPLLTLGIPGSTIGAIMMGVFLVHGIQVGPTIFTTNGDLVFAMFAAGLMGVICYGLIGWFFSGYVGKLIAVAPPRLIYPTVLFLAFLATYSVRSNLFDLAVMIIFGLIGYFMRKFDFSNAALVISFVLAPGAEVALRQTMKMSSDDPMIFFERPVAVIFFLISIVVVATRSYGFWKRTQEERRGRHRQDPAHPDVQKSNFPDVS